MLPSVHLTGHVLRLSLLVGTSGGWARMVALGSVLLVLSRRYMAHPEMLRVLIHGRWMLLWL